MFNLYDVVKLNHNRDNIGIKAGALGTVVDVLNYGEAYTVEFFDDNNKTIKKSLFTHFTANELDLLSPEDTK